MSRLTGLLLGGILLLLLIGTVTGAGINLTAESGETWISWEWDAGLNVTATVDGGTVITGITGGRYISEDLNPSEKHHISLKDAETGAAMDELEAVTAPSIITIIAVLAVSILFTVLLMMARDEIRGTICGLLGAISGFYLAWIAHQALIGHGILGLILGTVNIGVIALSLYEKLGKKRSTWGIDDD